MTAARSKGSGFKSPRWGAAKPDNHKRGFIKAYLPILSLYKRVSDAKYIQSVEQPPPHSSPGLCHPAKLKLPPVKHPSPPSPRLGHLLPCLPLRRTRHDPRVCGSTGPLSSTSSSSLVTAFWERTSSAPGDEESDIRDGRTGHMEEGASHDQGLGSEGNEGSPSPALGTCPRRERSRLLSE